jgi:hypothetical protein
MTQPSASFEFTRLQNMGMLVFVLLCGVPALEMNGFGFGLSLTLPMALAKCDERLLILLMFQKLQATR